MISEHEKLESAEKEIEALKKEISELRDSQSGNTSYAWIWLAFIFFFGCLLMGNIALDYKNEYEEAIKNINKHVPDSIASNNEIITD